MLNWLGNCNLAVSMYHVRLFLLAFFSLLFLKANAEVFDISIKGSKQLSNLAAIEITFGFEPNSFLVEKDFSVDLPNVLFKTVDQTHSVLRAFFNARPAGFAMPKEIHIKGKLSRVNYNGEIKSYIKSVKYISDFSKQINVNDIETTIVVNSGLEDEPIPYIGISSAKILGPSQRMSFNPLLIAVGDIETYGFTLDKSVTEVLINGQKARFVSDKIIAATIPIPADLVDGVMAVELSVKVHNTEVKKNLGSIKLIEVFN